MFAEVKPRVTAFAAVNIMETVTHLGLFTLNSVSQTPSMVLNSFDGRYWGNMEESELIFKHATLRFTVELNPLWLTG